MYIALKDFSFYMFILHNSNETHAVEDSYIIYDKYDACNRSSLKNEATTKIT